MITPGQIQKALAVPRENILQRKGDHDIDLPGTRSRAMAYAKGTLEPRSAAVLIGLVARDNGLQVILTRRTEHLTDHAGQISFPGGRQEPQDQTPEATALRETFEEIGLENSHIHLAGRITDYYTVTGYRITPVVGFIQPPFSLLPDENEVAEIFEVPLDFILDRKNQKLQTVTYNGEKRRYFAIPYENYYIWGATAGMLINFSEILKVTMD